MKINIVAGFIIVILSIGCFLSKASNDVLIQLDNKYDSEFKISYKETPLDTIFDKYFDTLNTDIIEFLKIDTTTNMLFKKYNIQYVYEQSYIIMYLWYQKLNNKSLSVEEYLKKINEKRNKNKKKYENIRKIAESNFLKFSIGDTIMIKYPVSISVNGDKNAFKYDEPVQWEFDSSKDLIIKGKILDKIYNQITQDDYSFKVKIIEMNRTDTYFFMKYLGIGDTTIIDLMLHSSKIEKINF